MRLCGFEMTKPGGPRLSCMVQRVQAMMSGITRSSISCSLSLIASFSFHALDAQLVAADRHHGVDGRIEVRVFLFQTCDGQSDFGLFLIGHACPVSLIVLRAAPNHPEARHQPVSGEALITFFASGKCYHDKIDFASNSCQTVMVLSQMRLSKATKHRICWQPGLRVWPGNQEMCRAFMQVVRRAMGKRGPCCPANRGNQPKEI